jgi:2-polyprenyl-6-methoxyphenol hydroxylase-like FAD-dependent oxidoreductase
MLERMEPPQTDPVTGAEAPLDVLVVGAGPTGLALAAQLRAHGAGVRVVDRQADRVHESRALAIQPRTLEVLSGLGISRTLLERGNQAVQMRLHLGTRTVRAGLFDIGIQDTAYPFLLFLSQAETERVLLDHLAAAGVAVERRVELAAFTAGQHQVTCTLRHHDGRTEQASAHYLVGCDGARSTVRDLAGIGFAGGSYPQTFVLADLEADGDVQRDTVHVYVCEAGMLFLFPLGSPATWRLLGMAPDGGAAAASPGAGGAGIRRRAVDPSLRDVQALADRFTGGSVSLRDPVWLTTFQLQHRQAAHYRAGRVFLAGDAAHVHSPAGAQGMNTGIQDAWNLGWKLALVARGLAAEALLDSYHAERWPVGRFVLRFTDRAFTLATSSGPLARVVRTRVAPSLAPLAARFGPGRALGFRAISQLGVRYRGSPAVQEGRPSPHGGPRAGDRLPDGPLAHDGRPRWLHESLGGPGFHLLLCGPAEAWDGTGLQALGGRWGGLVGVHRLAPKAGPGVLHDDGTLLRRLGVAGTAQYLVRPDGHVGYRAAGTDLDGLQAYLEHWLPGAAALTRAP